MLYYSFIYPFLIYGVQVWGLTYPTYLKLVTTLQKRLAGILTFSEPMSHSEPLLKSLNLLKFNDIIHSEILSFVYQGFHKLVPSCFFDFFKPMSSIHEYPTRQSLNENLFIKSIRTTQYGIRSLHYTGSNLWNSLPITQGHPSTVFCKISVWISKCHLKVSTAPERLKISRSPLHSTRIFGGFVSTSLVFSEAVFLTFISPNSTFICKKVPLRISLKRK